MATQCGWSFDRSWSTGIPWKRSICKGACSSISFILSHFPWQVPFVTGDCDDEGTYADRSIQCVLITDFSDSLFSLTTTNITYVFRPSVAVSTSAHEICMVTISNNAEFLAYIQAKYVMWFMIVFTSHCHLISSQLLRRIAFSRTTHWSWPGLSGWRYKGVSFVPYYLLKDSNLSLTWYRSSLGISFRHGNLERYIVSYTKLWGWLRN